MAGQRTVLLVNPGSDRYGSDRMLLESASAFASADWRVVATVPTYGELVPLLRERGAEVVVCRTAIVRKSALSAAGFARLLLDFVLSVRPGLQLLRRVKPDLVYVNTVTPPLWFLLARIRRVPCLCHVHEAEGTASKLVLRGLLAPLLLCPLLVVNSEFSLDVLRRAFRRLGDRARVVYNAVPERRPHAPRARLTGSVRIVYVGRLSPRKGVHVAAEAVGMLAARGRDVRLDLVGAVFPGYEWYEADVRAMVDDMGVGDRMTWHGFQPDPAPYVAAADVVIVPSTIDEPFGNTAIEAVLSARPVVVSDVGGLPEAVAGVSSALLAEPGSAASLTSCIERVIDRWDQFALDSSESAPTAARRFSGEAYASAILDAAVCAVRLTSRKRVRRHRPLSDEIGYVR